MPPPHPLRRISTGSLSNLARSQDRSQQSASGLDFLTGAITELSDEAATLASNISKLNELSDSLGVFNEAFAGWLYALKMNAFCVEWPLAPNECSFERLPALMQAAQAHMQALQNPPTPGNTAGPSGTGTTATPPSGASAATGGSNNPGDMTYATSYSERTDEPAPAAAAPKTAKKIMVRKMVNGPAKRKRELEIASIIDTLPLEYRGREPAMRMGMEKVIGSLMDNPGGLSVKDFVSPELPQAKANKHLIALVTKKLVTKTSVGGIAFYKWQGPN